ncbi:MAG: hypothetical protein LBK95_20015 [Bifidobacteriaceae bacterium]|jgi:hypothetical protein|nr:hypothetical protein [Bifidobacteriaceae bacterium]
MTHSALFVGIDSYDFFPDLEGCGAGALRLAQQFHGDNPSWDWGDPAQTALTGPVRREIFQDRLVSVLEAARGGDESQFLFYYAGRGASNAGDLLLAAANFKPYGDKNDPHAIRLTWLLNQIRHRDIRRATLILDCGEAQSVESIPVPSGTVVIANDPTLEDDQRDNRFTGALLHGASGGEEGMIEDSKVKAWDPTGRITAQSLFGSVAAALRVSGTDPKRVPPVMKGWLDATLLKSVRLLSDEDMEVLRQFEPTSDGGEFVRDLTPDMEYPGPGASIEAMRWRVGRDLKKGLGDLAKRRPNTAFSFRSRPPNYKVPAKANTRAARDQRLMESLKRLRDAGLVRVCLPEGEKDLFWACLWWGQVCLTEAGKAAREQLPG